MTRSVDCPLVLQPWHNDKSSEYWRPCCDQVPLKPAERKALMSRSDAATAKAK